MRSQFLRPAFALPLLLTALVTHSAHAQQNPLAHDAATAIDQGADRPSVPAPTAESSSPGVLQFFGTAQSQASAAIMLGLSRLGVRYQYGGNSPKSGFDCSGLVQWVFNQSLGLTLPRRSMEIAAMGTPVARADLQPGDLVFFNTLRRTFSHVGIYIGEGMFLHAPSTGGKVRIEPLDLAYWKQRFNGGRRIEAGPEADVN